MIISKEVRKAASYIIFNHAKFDRTSGGYTLQMPDVSNFDLYELSSLLMSSNKELALEVMSCDNPYFEKEMLPSLLFYLNDVTKVSPQEDYLCSVREAVIKYLEPTLKEVLYEELEEFNQNVDELHRDRKIDENYVWAA